MAWDGLVTSSAFISAQDMQAEIVRLSARYHALSAFPPEDGSAVNSGAAADASAFSAAVQCGFARVVEFAECGAAPSAVFACRWHFYWPLAGVLFLAVAAAFGVPDFA